LTVGAQEITLPARPSPQNKISTMPPLSEFLGVLRSSGHTAEDYLAVHYPRFVGTFEEFRSTSTPASGRRVLDVGAHWLHQSVLFAMQGFDVAALDLPSTFALADVKALAEAHRIRLLECADLEKPTQLDALPDGSFDVILFTEIIEHITFNPVGMWRQFHRLAAPGARIIVTTPNFYALRECLARLRRTMDRTGGGLSVTRILHQPTHAHHWKEYSLAELQQYFRLLSPDFRIAKSRYLHWPSPDASPKRWLPALVYRLVPMLKPALYLEIEVVGKSHGISIEPHW
jgi:2-polyprenyl-3-methyl-5-hydroxy-6-metoxy-1,4-benzoquinol methylase